MPEHELHDGMLSCIHAVVLETMAQMHYGMTVCCVGRGGIIRDVGGGGRGGGGGSGGD